MDNKDIEEKTYEQKKADFLDFLRLMAAVRAKKSEADAEEEMKEASLAIGKVMYTTYSGMLAAGFNERQALDLTKCLFLGANTNPVLKR